MILLSSEADAERSLVREAKIVEVLQRGRGGEFRRELDEGEASLRNAAHAVEPTEKRGDGECVSGEGAA